MIDPPKNKKYAIAKQFTSNQGCEFILHKKNGLKMENKIILFTHLVQGSCECTAIVNFWLINNGIIDSVNVASMKYVTYTNSMIRMIFRGFNSTFISSSVSLSTSANTWFFNARSFDLLISRVATLNDILCNNALKILII